MKQKRLSARHYLASSYLRDLREAEKKSNETQTSLEFGSFVAHNATSY